MIVKRSQKDREEDIKKAFKLFADTQRSPAVITKDSLKKVVRELGEEMTDQQIMQLIIGANSDLHDEGEESKDKGKGDKK